MSKVKKVHREQAILLCRIAATDVHEREFNGDYFLIAAALGWDVGEHWRKNPARHLAARAWRHARDGFGYEPSTSGIAETLEIFQQYEAAAAQLLEEGWSKS